MNITLFKIKDSIQNFFKVVETEENKGSYSNFNTKKVEIKKKSPNSKYILKLSKKFINRNSNIF